MNNNMTISESELLAEFRETICQLQYAAAGDAVRNDKQDIAALYREQIDEVELAQQKLMDDSNLLQVMSIMIGVISERRDMLAKQLQPGIEA